MSQLCSTNSIRASISTASACCVIKVLCGAAAAVTTAAVATAAFVSVSGDGTAVGDVRCGFDSAAGCAAAGAAVTDVTGPADVCSLTLAAVHSTTCSFADPRHDLLYKYALLHSSSNGATQTTPSVSYELQENTPAAD